MFAQSTKYLFRVTVMVCFLLLDSFQVQSQTREAVWSAPTKDSISGHGVYQVASYTDFVASLSFRQGTIYYPVDTPGRIGGVAVSPGYTETQRHVDWWGPRLASHGYAVLVLDTNEPGDLPEVRAEALIEAVRILRREHQRKASPLFKRMNVREMAVMGHSMGGGGALIAANKYGDEIQAAIPFTSWQPDGVFDRVTVPTLVIAGENDRIAPVEDHAWPHFLSIPSTTPKVYMEFDESDHFIADSERGMDLETVGRYGIAWLKIYLDNDERYASFIYGDEQQLDQIKFSRYVTNP